MVLQRWTPAIDGPGATPLPDSQRARHAGLVRHPLQDLPQELARVEAVLLLPPHDPLDEQLPGGQLPRPYRTGGCTPCQQHLPRDGTGCL